MGALLPAGQRAPDPGGQLAAPAPRLDGLRVALVDAPWDEVGTPSLQCGLLAAELAGLGAQVDVHYLNLECAAAIGPRRYRTVSSYRADRRNLLGEWLFGVAAFGEAGDEAAYWRDSRGLAAYLAAAGSSFREMQELRNDILPRWVSDTCAKVSWDDYLLVGFSSCFEQNCATLALSRTIKEQCPQVPLVFGGANFDGSMGAEYQRCLPWLDYVVSGEGDSALPELARALAAGEPGRPIPGVLWRPAREAAGDHGVPPRAARIRDLDALPMPDYDAYYATLKRLGWSSVSEGSRPHLLMETSRGCWWGEKHHCTFCGLNDAGMAFRAKSADRTARELAYLTSRHETLRVDMVDDIIAPDYAVTLASLLTAAGNDYDIFYEIKANTRPDQLLALRQAGITGLQPGIESLSSHVLELMRKGTDMLLNVRFLKWATAYDIRVVWNVLMGFPGECDEDYRRQAELLPSLHHLTPPGGCGRIWLERFSPYFEDPALGLMPTRPARSYPHVYPVEGIVHAKIAYFFEYQARSRASARSMRQLYEAVQHWRSAARGPGLPPTLTMRRGPGFAVLTDTRSGDIRRATLRGWRASAYELCGVTALSPDRVVARLAGEGGEEVDAAAVDRFLQACVTQRLAVSEGGRYLTLALPARPGPVPARPGWPGSGSDRPLPP